MENVDLYLRKSKRPRSGERNLSFEAQEERGRRWAADNGYTVRHVWRDNLSGWSDVVRPEFDKALAGLLADEVPCLWCYALDRWTRQGAAAVIPILDSGKRIVFDFERLDSSEPRDRRWIIDRAENAREYSDLVSTRVRGTKKVQRDSGAWLGAAPYGLAVGPGRKLMHGEAWRHVVRVIGLVAEGYSGRGAARAMNEDGIPAPNGGAWAAGTIRRMVHNPVYEGWQVRAKSRKHTWPVPYLNESGQRVRVFAEGVEPVDSALVQRARRVMSGHQPGRQGARPGRATHLLTDLLRCEGCGARMPASGRSYACNGHAMGKPCPRPASVMRVLADEAVTREWFGFMGTRDLQDPVLGIVAERWHAINAPEQSAEAAETQAAVKAATASLEQLMRDRQAGLYAGLDKLFRNLHADARATLETAEERAAKLKPRVVDITFLLEDELLEWTWDAAGLPTRREMLRLAVEDVTVRQGTRGQKWDPEERLTIRWVSYEG